VSSHLPSNDTSASNNTPVSDDTSAQAPPADPPFQDQQLELGEAEGLTTLRRAWERTLRALAGSLSKQNINNWLRPLKPLSYSIASTDSVVVLGAPSSFAREFVEKKYAQTLAQLLAQYLDAPAIQVRFVISTPDVQPLLGENPLPLQQAAALSSTAMTGESGLPVPAPQTSLAEAIFDGSTSSAGAKSSRNPFALELSASPLVPRYTFDNFVVGKSNRLAQAGAVAVAQSPGATYNPLFLYGPPGLGKTHLMHAIGHQIRLSLPQARVVYVSGEMFTNHYVTAIRDKRTEDFRRAYRNVDVWLVDDIQMLASKEQTKEEFFHTFNALHQMNKQIVLSSDRPPRELRAMDERLRSRFECGLVADITAPELEMRQAILQKKAILEDLAIPEEVIAFMANLIQSNIRALEGALIKLMAYASLIHSPVTKQLASDVLSSYYVERITPREMAVREQAAREPVSAHPEDHLPGFGGQEAARQVSSRPPVSAGGAGVDRVIEAVAAQMGVTRALIVAGGGRSNRATRMHGDANFARQVAMYLTKEMGGVPLSTLAATFGLKSHTAIVHASARLQKEMETDPQILSLISKIKQEIERDEQR
jgi:chromosomal replication initiator protein